MGGWRARFSGGREWNQVCIFWTGNSLTRWRAEFVCDSPIRCSSVLRAIFRRDLAATARIDAKRNQIIRNVMNYTARTLQSSAHTIQIIQHAIHIVITQIIHPQLHRTDHYALHLREALPHRFDRYCLSLDLGDLARFDRSGSLWQTLGSDDLLRSDFLRGGYCRFRSCYLCFRLGGSFDGRFRLGGSFDGGLCLDRRLDGRFGGRFSWDFCLENSFGFRRGVRCVGFLRGGRSSRSGCSGRRVG